MTTRFRRFLLAPLTTVLLILFAYISGRFGYSTTLALPFAALSLGAWYGGLRANLASAFIISLYAFFFYDPFRFASVAVSSFAIAGASGMLKRSLRETIIEAEHYRLRLLDTFNGNKAKLKAALDELDTLRDEMYGEAKKNNIWKARLTKIETVRGKLADLVLLVDSYHQMAEDRRLVEQGEKDHRIESYIEALRDKAEDESLD